MAVLGSGSSRTAPRAAQPAVKRVAAKRTAPAPTPVPYRPGRTPQPPGVEPGVTGKEKRFQQSRAFGPGPIKPYKHEEPTTLSKAARDRINGIMHRYGAGRTLPQEPSGHTRKGAPLFGESRRRELVDRAERKRTTV